MAQYNQIKEIDFKYNSSLEVLNIGSNKLKKSNLLNIIKL